MNKLLLAGKYCKSVILMRKLIMNKLLLAGKYCKLTIYDHIDEGISYKETAALQVTRITRCYFKVEMRKSQ